MWGNASLIFVSKVIMIVFGYRSFEHYLKGNAWRTSLIDTTFFGIGIWMQRIMFGVITYENEPNPFD
jgi:hypothetical protein